MHSKLDERAGDSYVLPPLTDKQVGADFARFMRGLDGRHTMAAIEKLRSFDRPVLIAWSRDDKFFHAGERLASDIPGARLEWIEDARTFSMEDQPARVAELIAGFVREPATVEA
jgi:pimeloyl-ACP methyl ester carboxylesterase